MNMRNCVYCGNELKNFIGTQKEYIDGKTIIINNVPLVRCSDCNEEYITPEIMDIINKIVLSFSEEELNKEDNIIVDFNEFLDGCKK